MAGIYVHIPFCKSKCYYCDFYSLPSIGLAGRYIDCVLAEAELRREECRDFTTLYIGGGTPSQLPHEEFQRLSDRLHSALGLDSIQEYTVEVNPDDVTPALLRTLAQCGVNRLSMGVQSFNDDELQAVGRRHTARQAEQAVELMRKHGFDNISIDLINGLPKQSLASWRESVQRAINLDVEHISAYNLSYERGTRLTAMRNRGEIEEATDELCVEMFELMTQMLANAGYEHYEISNFAKPHCRSLHNSSYWDFTPYLGLGAAAHSFDGTTRRANPANIHRYCEAIERGTTAFTTETLTEHEHYDEMVMLRLRTAEGLSLEQVEEQFGAKVRQYLTNAAKEHLTQGNLKLENGTLSLTSHGIMVSNEIIADLMSDDNF